MADPELLRRLNRIHQVLELIAFLVAVHVATTSSLGVVVGGVAAFVIVLNRIVRYRENADPNAGL